MILRRCDGFALAGSRPHQVAGSARLLVVAAPAALSTKHWIRSAGSHAFALDWSRPPAVGFLRRPCWRMVQEGRMSVWAKTMAMPTTLI